MRNRVTRLLFAAGAKVPVGPSRVAASVPADLPAVQLPAEGAPAPGVDRQRLGLRGGHGRVCLVQRLPQQPRHDVRAARREVAAARASCRHDGRLLPGARDLRWRQCRFPRATDRERGLVLARRLCAAFVRRSHCLFAGLEKRNERKDWLRDCRVLDVRLKVDGVLRKCVRHARRRLSHIRATRLSSFLVCL